MRARKRWSLRLGVAILPDTNIGAGSDERTIILNIPVRRPAPPFTPGQLHRAQIRHRHLGLGRRRIPVPAGRPRNGVRGKPAGGCAPAATLSRKEYRESEFDQMTLSGHVGPRWLIGRASEASLLLSGLHHWTGSGIEEPSHHDIGFRVEGRHRLSPRTTLNARASRHERRYDKRTRWTGRSPMSRWARAGWSRRPLRIDAGLGWSRERTEIESLAQFQPLGAARGHGAAALGLHRRRLGHAALDRLRGRLGPLHRARAAPQRPTATRTIRLFAHNRALTLEGFSPQVSVTQEQRTTNAQLHDYERIFGELRFVRLFDRSSEGHAAPARPQRAPGPDRRENGHARGCGGAPRAARPAGFLPGLRRAGGVLFGAALTLGFLALVLAFTR